MASATSSAVFATVFVVSIVAAFGFATVPLQLRRLRFSTKLRRNVREKEEMDKKGTPGNWHSAAIGATGSALARSLANPDNVNLEAFDDSIRLYHFLAESTSPGGNSSLSDMSDAYASALQVLADALRLYGPECVYGSYNGGKDAVAIMHLLRAAIAHYSV